MSQGGWIDDPSDAEEIRFVIWSVALLGVAVAATALLMHAGEPNPTDEARRELIRLAISCGAALLIMSILGGLFVFRSTTSWDIAATFPFVGGSLVAAGYFAVVVIAGESASGSGSCDGSCEHALGLGAFLLAVAATIPIAASFIASYGTRRLVVSIWRRSQAGRT